MRIFKSALLGGVFALAVGAAAANADILLYQNNFDGNEARDAGVSGAFSGLPTEAANGNAVANAAGWVNNYGASRATRIDAEAAPFTGLYLTGLADHTSISATFLLGFLESWDGYDGGCCSPDNLEIWIDGVKVANMTAINALGTVADFDMNPVLLAGTGGDEPEINGNGYYSDSLIDYSLTFAHTGSTLDFEFRAFGAGWQGGDDEGYGLDRVVFTYDGVHTPTPPGGVPEPATWGLMIMGFGLAGATLRRRRTVLAG